MKFKCISVLVLLSMSLSVFASDKGDVAEHYYDGIWLSDSGQYFSVQENGGQVVVLQLDDKVRGGTDRLWQSYFGEITAPGFATVQTMLDFADVHTVLDFHFDDDKTGHLYYSSCDSFKPDCDHFDDADAPIHRIW